MIKQLDCVRVVKLLEHIRVVTYIQALPHTMKRGGQMGRHEKRLLRPLGYTHSLADHRTN